MATWAYTLLSGGIDSSTCLALAVNDWGKEYCKSISIHYGQRHDKELDAAQEISDHYEVSNELLTMTKIKSVLTTQAPIPHVSYSELPPGPSPTYAPFRNGRLLSLATAFIYRDIEESKPK